MDPTPLPASRTGGGGCVVDRDRSQCIHPSGGARGAISSRGRLRRPDLGLGVREPPPTRAPRAPTRSTAVRPSYIRSNFFVARGNAGNRLGSTPRGTRTVLPYVLPALHTPDIGHSQPSCLAGQRYFNVPRPGSWPMNAIL